MNLPEIKRLLSDPVERQKLSVGKLQELLEIVKEATSKSGRVKKWPSPAAMAFDWSRRHQGRYTWDKAKHLDLINEWLLDLESGKRERVMISMPPRSGKACDDETLVVTPSGVKKHGDLVVGDYVYSPEGKPVRVLAVSEPIEEEAVEVVFDFGSVVVHPNHEWLVEEDCERYVCFKAKPRHRHETILETKDLLRKKRMPAVPLAAPIERSEVDLPIDPYILGMWLGDGNSNNAYITVGKEDAAHAAKYGPIKYDPRNDYYRLLVPGLQKKLRSEGLLKNKHIPEIYLRGSIAQRLAILQGLLDTDGTASQSGQCDFSNNRYNLAHGVYQLLHSLGVKASIVERRAKLYGKDCGPHYRVSFSPGQHLQWFRLERKQARVDSVKRRPRAYRRYLRQLRPAGKRSLRCIQVEGSMYCVGLEMIPTHNSELISFWYPVWLITHNPLLQIMFVTYGGEFAAQWGARVRNFIKEYGDEFGVELRVDTSSRTRWELTAGGGMYAVGTGGQITGRGADRLIVDDPIKGDEAARSQLQRDQMLQWWQQTAYTRLEPRGKIAMVGTRWHQEDLLGRLEALSDADVGAKWDVMKLPALAVGDDDPLGRKEGEALWPERWPREKLLQIKDGQISDPLNPTGSPYAWSALYQQTPTPEEGASIKRTWWKTYSIPPQNFDDIIMSWDLAFKDLASSDFVVGQVWGRLGGEFYLLDMIRDRMNFPETIEAFKNLVIKWPQARRKLVEDSANAPALVASLAREIPGIIPIKPKGSKDARLSAVAPAIQSGNVFIPEFKQAKWVLDVVEEAATFPNAAHDDCVDALSQALNYFMPSGHAYTIKAAKDAKFGAEAPKTTAEMMFRDFHKRLSKEVDKNMRRKERSRPRWERMRVRF